MSRSRIAGRHTDFNVGKRGACGSSAWTMFVMDRTPVALKRAFHKVYMHLICDFPVGQIRSAQTILIEEFLNGPLIKTE